MLAAKQTNMADADSKSDSDKNSENVSVFSTNFDALSALYSENIILPWREAPTLDNIAKYESLAAKSTGDRSVDEVNMSILSLFFKKN